jgi:hypothetical protein
VSEDLVRNRGRNGVLAHKNQFHRDEKDSLRDDVVSGFVDDIGNGWYFVATTAVKTLDRGEQYGDEHSAHAPEPESESFAAPVAQEESAASEPPVVGWDVELDKLTVAQLKSLAVEMDIELQGATLKADIVDAIRLGTEG